MKKAYKYRIYPKKKQEAIFAKTFGCVRLAWNLMLKEKLNAYKYATVYGNGVKNSETVL